MIKNAIKNKFSLVFALLFLVNLAGCATERTATGDPIEKGTVEYGISTEERTKLDSIPISIRFWQDRHIRAFGHDPNDARIIDITLDMDAQSAALLFEISFEGVGTLSKPENIGNLNYIGKIGSGVLNLNPALFLVELKQSKDTTVISIVVVAFEGLIKQYTVGKAIERLIISMEENSGGKISWR
ncbi:hypothetical protein [Sneathiella sp. HT1-7]|uniref:hypothetical protein n=1 Tax=Sneathiella sp. HT1-7 TaxID=2887192 RepID=UPI001D1389C2|nr:hypothetical protein [Sneathiella sp. HT1-7]MCC3303638.1 hypothetical protein [Sneathiella sp. HT1-7]